MANCQICALLENANRFLTQGFPKLSWIFFSDFGLRHLFGGNLQHINLRRFLNNLTSYPQQPISAKWGSLTLQNLMLITLLMDDWFSMIDWLSAVCPSLTCPRIGCVHGFARDENGCELCHCASAPVCPAIGKQTHTHRHTHTHTHTHIQSYTHPQIDTEIHCLYLFAHNCKLKVTVLANRMIWATFQSMLIGQLSDHPPLLLCKQVPVILRINSWLFCV